MTKPSEMPLAKFTIVDDDNHLYVVVKDLHALEKTVRLTEKMYPDKVITVLVGDRRIAI